ncbi:MAG: hypothetical protein IPJ86_13775 [Bacteroidetes bacterium]|nr:hypothetical protein [Bacteroidota bacterium]
MVLCKVCSLVATGCQLPASGYRLPATGFRLPATGYQLPATCFRLPAVEKNFRLCEKVENFWLYVKDKLLEELILSKRFEQH